ncbi:MAG: molecular chaperone HtpG [Peptoniphilaceae bacterium]|nr:molecular chaperone HtpG [Peptoniphilaceae bacterium]
MKPFETESQRLLDLMIHSIYTNREIFLRELISNASDAIDKMYVKSLEDEDLTFDPSQFTIRLTPNKEQRTLQITDAGIGMDEADLERNLGTIAHSGTLDFKKANSTHDVSSIIGQFGVGFYSAFMVADRVEVISRKYGAEKAYRWTSDGVTGYDIEEWGRDAVGTDVILHLREDAEDENYSQFLEEFTLKQLVRTYSNYIRYPIQMEVTKTRRVEQPKTETVAEGQNGADAANAADAAVGDAMTATDQADTTSASDAEAADEVPQYESYQELETLNSMTPIWNKPKSELTDEDYKSLYHQERFGYEDPLAWTHIVADGTLSYRAILYLPASVPYDYYTKDYKKGLTLYSSGVKIMEHAETLLPDYYGFVQGVVSSEDLSLNISRETLQQDRQLAVIARGIEKKITDALLRLRKEDPERYQKFFENFGSTLKVGIYQSFGAKADQLGKLLVFPTSRSMQDGEDAHWRALDDVVADLEAPDTANREAAAASVPDGDAAAENKAEAPQSGDAAAASATDDIAADEEEERPKSKIYYATGESAERIDTSPAMVGLHDRGIEVLYLTDRVDEFALKTMREYKGHAFQSIFDEDFSLNGADAATEANAAEADTADQTAVFEEMKKALGDDVVAVKASKRLVDDAVILVAQGEISIEMEKAFAEQPNGGYIKAQKVLEVNPAHPVYAKLQQLKEAGDNETFEAYAKMLYDQARLIAGLPLEDPVAYAKAVQKLMEK